MSETQGYQRNVLEDRGWIDRWGFLLFAFGGAAGILISKAVGLAAIPVAAGAAIAMVAYAFVVQTSGTGRLRADQAGDNCYYLGLIYTLISLAYAIFFFDPATTATTVVQGFGIALATTIMGLILRVFFNQSRVDLVETEDTARIELADAAGRLKAELQAMTVSMSDYGRETRQALEELRTQIVSDLVDVQGQATKAIAETLAVASDAISMASMSSRDGVAAMSAEATLAVSHQSTEAIARAKRMSSATDKIITSIEKHAVAMGGIERSSTAIAASLVTLEGAADRTQQNLGELSRRSEELAGAQETLANTGNDLRGAVVEMVNQIKGLDATTARFDTTLRARLEELKDVPGDMAARTAEAFQRASSAMHEQFTAIAGGQQEFASQLSLRTEESVAILDRHNAAMEEELARSRDNVSKVHGALVDMTADLVSHVRATGA